MQMRAGAELLEGVGRGGFVLVVLVMSPVNHAPFFRLPGCCCCFVSKCCVAGMNGDDVTLSCGCRFHSC